MAGRISDRDIAAIRERVRIEDVVGDYVQLRRAGADSLKGLCPFHDEKSPSFHVRPNHGHFHCFGCGEGGDVFAFVQKIEHVSFVEAVEMLADRLGYTLTYTGASATHVQRDRGSRSRLVAANAAAAEFYAAALESDEAAPARQYLTERNFDAEAARRFGCGFAPSGWDSLTKHLQRKGFEFKELEAAGLSREGRRGPMDRFHRRLLWPIRTASGEVIGFGARRLFDDDPMEAKYINTPETLLYKKSSVLFGIDLAKRDIAKGHQAVVVEGYTDVMAMHLAGVATAVASCGTAFGDEHLSMLRRLMMDDSFFRGELIYVFDGDAAGRAAAPQLGAALARVGMGAAHTADRLGMSRLAVSGTVLVYGIQFYRGVREETGSLGDMMREYREFKGALASVTESDSLTSKTLMESIKADHAMLHRSQGKYGVDANPRPLAAEAVQNIGLQILVAYRIMRALLADGHGVGAKAMSRMIRHLYGSDIHWEADFAPGIVLVHGFGLAICKSAKVGEGCILFHGVTLGLGRDGKTGETGGPRIERDVHVGVGATLVGPITIGRESKIMAGCTVTTSIPARSLVESPAPAVRPR